MFSRGHLPHEPFNPPVSQPGWFGAVQGGQGSNWSSWCKHLVDTGSLESRRNCFTLISSYRVKKKSSKNQNLQMQCWQDWLIILCFSHSDFNDEICLLLFLQALGNFLLQNASLNLAFSNHQFSLKSLVSCQFFNQYNINLWHEKAGITGSVKN